MSKDAGVSSAGLAHVFNHADDLDPAAVLCSCRLPEDDERQKKVRTRKMIRELRTLGYHVELSPAPSSSPA